MNIALIVFSCDSTTYRQAVKALNGYCAASDVHPSLEKAYLVGCSVKVVYGSIVAFGIVESTYKDECPSWVEDCRPASGLCRSVYSTFETFIGCVRNGKLGPDSGLLAAANIRNHCTSGVTPKADIQNFSLNFRYVLEPVVPVVDTGRGLSPCVRIVVVFI